MAANPPQGAVEINIQPEEWRILVLVNGQRSVSEIADAMEMDDFAAMKTLYGLVSAGLIEVPGHESQYEEVEEEVEEDEPQAEAQVETPADAVEAEETGGQAFPEPEPVPEAEAEPEPVAQAEPEQAAQQEPEVPVEQFDAPAPGDLISQVPEVDEMPTEAELAAEMGLAPAVEEPAPREAEAPPFPEPVSANEPGAPDIPVSSEPSGEAPQVDRIAAVRELAGLFSEGEDSGSKREAPRAFGDGGESPGDSDDADGRKRVEDDDQVTRGLISRLIDGVKGL
jgi:hypothetical protein